MDLLTLVKQDKFQESYVLRQIEDEQEHIYLLDPILEQKLQKLLEERIKTTKDTTIKSQYELMYARVQRYMND